MNLLCIGESRTKDYSSSTPFPSLVSCPENFYSLAIYSTTFMAHSTPSYMSTCINSWILYFVSLSCWWTPVSTPRSVNYNGLILGLNIWWAQVFPHHSYFYKIVLSILIHVFFLENWKKNKVPVSLKFLFLLSWIYGVV